MRWCERWIGFYLLDIIILANGEKICYNYEESGGVYRTYHFDYRGSTVAITDICGNITDTFAYDTYGKLNSRTGNTDTPFMYNGRDGVVTDANGLLYMRARYYSPDLMRFVNADIVAGDISNAITLNRYAYANGNPVSNKDPLGLKGIFASIWDKTKEIFNDVKETVVNVANTAGKWVEDVVDRSITINQQLQETNSKIQAEQIQMVYKLKNKVEEDVQKFDWNNTDEQKVIDSNYFSAYKGQFVIREDFAFTDGRSGSFGVMFLNSNETDVNTVKHEYGHFIQLNLLGIRRYIQYVCIPSINSGDVQYEEYYSLPFESSADLLGGVERIGYNYTNDGNGFVYDTYKKDFNNIANFAKSIFSNTETTREK